MWGEAGQGACSQGQALLLCRQPSEGCQPPAAPSTWGVGTEGNSLLHSGSEDLRQGEWCHQAGPGWELVSRDQMAWNPLILTFGVMVLEKGAIRTTLVQYLKGCGKLSGGP